MYQKNVKVFKALEMLNIFTIRVIVPEIEF